MAGLDPAIHAVEPARFSPARASVGRTHPGVGCVPNGHDEIGTKLLICDCPRLLPLSGRLLVRIADDGQVTPAEGGSMFAAAQSSAVAQPTITVLV
jgi:hypothetical protein